MTVKILKSEDWDKEQLLKQLYDARQVIKYYASVNILEYVDDHVYPCSSLNEPALDYLNKYQSIDE